MLNHLHSLKKLTCVINLGLGLDLSLALQAEEPFWQCRSTVAMQVVYEASCLAAEPLASSGLWILVPGLFTPV